MELFRIFYSLPTFFTFFRQQRHRSFSNVLLITDFSTFFQAIASSFLLQSSIKFFRIFYSIPTFLLFSGNSVIVPSIVINPACTAEEIPYISLDEFLSPDSDENSSLIRQEGKHKQKPTFSLVALLVDVTYLQRD